MVFPLGYFVKSEVQKANRNPVKDTIITRILIINRMK